ncbi:hypothetical protein [Legionella shakespearei]|uniref:Uncharacterized protein n=1 Tax=Legionella shakespearei DSM 23087 TaxID=1122169 RepID=A0A0W0Z7F2_9GAMM|nr:hypothetical protein [Legionella shakespearei]KTD65056.1 hypothetical protein Lsha_0425 [Legionella shakespearei DSM 23087]
MSLTINELRALIQSAKQQLVASAETWLNTQGEINPPVRFEHWLDALRAPDSDALQRALQSKNFPLIREDLTHGSGSELILDTQPWMGALQVLLRQDSLPTRTGVAINLDAQTMSEPSRSFSQELVNSVLQYSEHAQPTEKKVYRPVSHMQQTPILIQIARITTLMGQLHQMESCLEVIQPQVDLRALQLTQAMIMSITVNEWRFVEPGVDTVNAYEQRLQLVRDQLMKVQQINLPNLTLFAKQISIQVSQFAQTLQFFTESLNEAFSSEQDNRSWLIKMLTYHPWHGMIHGLAVTLFGSRHVTHSNEGALEVDPATLSDLNAQLQQNLREPLVNLSTEYATLTQSVISELSAGQERVDNMRDNLNHVARQGLARLFALRTPTAILGPYGFFQRIHALAHTTPVSRGLLWEDQPGETQSRGLSLSGGSDE